MPSQEYIDHQQELLEVHRRLLAESLKQQALSGAASVQPSVVENIREARENISWLATLTVLLFLFQKAPKRVSRTFGEVWRTGWGYDDWRAQKKENENESCYSL